MAASVKINSGIPKSCIFISLMCKDGTKWYLTGKCVGERL